MTVTQASKQGEVLRYVWSEDNPGVTVPAVAEACDLKLSTARYGLHALETAGLARRDPGRTVVVEEYGSALMGAPFAGSRAVRRTPDIWWLTDAGMALVEGWMEVADA